MTNSEARKRKEELATPRIADDVTPFHTYHTTQAQMDEEGYCQFCDEGSEITRGHWHEIYVTREGANLHTADELASVFIDDVEALVSTYTRPEGLASPDGWCEDSDDSEALQDEIMHAESALADVGLYAHWDDGYVIGRVTEEDDAS